MSRSECSDDAKKLAREFVDEVIVEKGLPLNKVAGELAVMLQGVKDGALSRVAQMDRQRNSWRRIAFRLLSIAERADENGCECEGCLHETKRLQALVEEAQSVIPESDAAEGRGSDTSGDGEVSK